MVDHQREDSFESAGKWRHNKRKVAGDVLEYCKRALSDWNEENDRERAAKARHDPLSMDTEAQAVQGCAPQATQRLT